MGYTDNTDKIVTVSKEELKDVIEKKLRSAIRNEIRSIIKDMKNPKTYTNDEMMEILGVGRSKLKRLRDQKHIGHIKHGRRILYTQKHLENFLEKFEVKEG